MTYRQTTIVGLAVLMAGYAFHSRGAFLLYHAIKIVGLLHGYHR